MAGPTGVGNDIAGGTKSITTRYVLLLACTASAAMPVAASNLLTNGDFEQGVVGFHTNSTVVDYESNLNLSAPNRDRSWNFTIDQQYYTIAPTAKYITENAFRVPWNDTRDVTTGSGLYYITSGSRFNQIAWQVNDIAVKANTNYKFSFYMTDLSGPVANELNRPSLDLSFQELALNSRTCCTTDRVNYSNIVGTYGPGATLDDAYAGNYVKGQWYRIEAVFNTGSLTSLSLRLRNARAFTSKRYNDYGLDNMSLTEMAVVLPIGPGVPDSPTWMMMIAGFGLVGTSLRRRVRTTEVSGVARSRVVARGCTRIGADWPSVASTQIGHRIFGFTSSNFS